MTKKDYQILVRAMSDAGIGASQIRATFRELKYSYPNIDMDKFDSFLSKHGIHGLGCVGCGMGEITTETITTSIENNKIAWGVGTAAVVAGVVYYVRKKSKRR